jgi:hypothetical protein
MGIYLGFHLSQPDTTVVSQGGSTDVQDEGKSLDMTQDLSGFGNRIVVEDKDEPPLRIINSSFNFDTHSSSSEHTPEAFRSSSPSVSIHKGVAACR